MRFGNHLFVPWGFRAPRFAPYSDAMAQHPAKPVGAKGSTHDSGGSGFNGELRCASLADLVQLECLSGAREAVQVLSGGRKGHLFFEGGAMVHARAASLVGHEAALEVLSWSTGTFSASDLPWPAHNTITIPWQQLLMEAAKRADEQGRAALRGADSVAPGGDLVDFPHSSSQKKVSEAPIVEVTGESERNSGAPTQRPSVPTRAQPRSGAMPILRKPNVPPPPKVPAPGGASMAGAVGSVRSAVRLDDAGNVLAQRGDVDDLIKTAPFLKNTLDALGSVLGLENFRAFECVLGDRQLMVYRDTRTSSITLETALGANMEAVRAALKH